MTLSPWNLADLAEAVADALPDREAVVAGPARLTHGQLDRRANRLAHTLSDRGVGPGDHVGLALRNGVEYLEATLAAFKLRAVPINVNFRYTVDELAYVLTDAAMVAVIHDPELAVATEAAAALAPSVRFLLARGRPYESCLARASERRPVVAGRSGDDRYVVYTGGTTGAPKGVVWRHEDILFAALGGGNPGGEPVGSPDVLVAAAVAGRTRCLPASPLIHGTAQWAALATLLNGGTVVLEAGTNPVVLWDRAQAEEVNQLVIVGDAFARPLLETVRDQPTRWPLEHLLLILSGGAILSPEVRRGLIAVLPGTAVVDGYGTSETGGQGQMAAWPGQRDAAPPRFTMGADSAVLDERLRPVDPGSEAVGRLARRGRVPLGYHNDPGGTARTFPVIAGERWAVTGDLARVHEDGRVVLVGRGSWSINTGGEKVFPEEVEVVLKTHPSVWDAVVVGVPDDRWGEQVAAVVQARAGMSVTLDDLSALCRQRLAGFKVPRRLVLVDELVRHPSGKPDQRWARRTAQRGVPVEVGP